MVFGKTAMRAMLVVALTAALGGCYSVRHRHEVAAASADGKPAPKGKQAKEPREVLPSGLAGDREHHAYTDTPN